MSAMPTPRTQLIHRLRDNDPEAAGELFRVCYTEMQNIAVALLPSFPVLRPSKGYADEALQEASMRVHRYIVNHCDYLGSYADFRRVMTCQLWRELIKLANRHRLRASHIVFDNYVGLDVAAPIDAERLELDKRSELARLMPLLPKKIADVVDLGCNHGLKQKEIAERLGVSEKTVYLRLIKARELYKKFFKRDNGDHFA